MEFECVGDPIDHVEEAAETAMDLDGLVRQSRRAQRGDVFLRDLVGVQRELLEEAKNGALPLSSGAVRRVAVDLID